MATQFYRLLGHCAVAFNGFLYSTDLIVELKNAGGTQDFLYNAEKLHHRGESLIEKKTDKCGEDRIREHALHFAASEAEMWLETVGSKLRGKVEKSTISMVLAKDLHAHDHTVTVVAQVMRALSTIATDPTIANHLGEPRAVKDILARGNAALARLIKTGEIKMRPKEQQTSFEIFAEVDAFTKTASDWLASLNNMANQITTPELCGWLGLVPQGMGIQFGGASFGVERHGRGQTQSPSKEVKPCTGWSIGRQGNSENMGPGFIK